MYCKIYAQKLILAERKVLFANYIRNFIEQPAAAPPTTDLQQCKRDSCVWC